MLKNFLNPLLLIFFLATIQSCSLIKPAPVELNKKINIWLVKNDFYNIEKALDKISRNDTSYRNVLKRKAEITQKKDTFIYKSSKLASQYKSNNQWQKAITTYEVAIEKVGTSVKLETELDKLLTERNLKTLKLKCDLLIKQAKQAVSYKADYRQLNQLHPDDYEVKFDTVQFENNNKNIAIKLDQYAEQALELRQPRLARQCAQAAYDVSPSTERNKTIASIDRQLNKSNNNNSYSKLLLKYEVAYKAHDYLEAKKNLQSILNKNPKHNKARKLLTSLDKEITVVANEKILIGKELYSQKKIKEALITWKQAKSLLPRNDELNQLIQRAEKVSKKIESLEHNQ